MVRAEACTEEKHAALDMAIDKLMERLRRKNDRRQVHRGRRTPESVAQATARIPAPTEVEPAATDDATTDDPFGDSPVEVREKVHHSSPMTLSDALSQMELVGHDFYLFHDVDTDRASVVYRRRGWSYGVAPPRPRRLPRGVGRGLRRRRGRRVLRRAAMGWPRTPEGAVVHMVPAACDDG